MHLFIVIECKALQKDPIVPASDTVRCLCDKTSDGRDGPGKAGEKRFGSPYSVK